MGEKVELALAILYQNNYRTKDLNVDVNVNKAEANDNDLIWAEDQYPMRNPSVLKVFLANWVDLPVENTDSFESKGENYSNKKFFVVTTSKNEPEYCSLKPAMMTQFKKQQNDRFYNYS